MKGGLRLKASKRKITQDILQLAVALGAQEGFHASTYRRRRRVMELWNEFVKMVPHPSVALFLRVLELLFAPSTALGYAATLALTVPTLSQDPQLKEGLRYLKKLAGKSQLRRKQAVPMSPLEMTELIKTATMRIKSAAIVIWLTASRHADYLEMELTKVWRVKSHFMLLFQMSTFKSDLFGKRFVQKYVLVPKPLGIVLQHHMLEEKRVSYSQLYRAVKRVNKTLSCHSFRRGAISLLTNEGHKAERIILLSAHAMPNEPTAIRRYADPSPTSSTALRQGRLTQSLLTSIGLN